MVTWKGCGRPSLRRAMASPSSSSSRGASARAHSTSSGTRAVTSCSSRVNTRTSSPALWSWMRAPSSLYSNEASPRRRSASSTSFAGLASMGAIGESTRSEKRTRPAAPCSSAARATSPRLGANMAACRTAAGGRPAARATASRTRPSSAPCRISPSTRSTRKCRSASRARSNNVRSAFVRRSSDPEPRSVARRAKARSTSTSMSGSPCGGRAAARAERIVLQPSPMRPCGSEPVRYIASSSASRPRACRSRSAISATFSSFFEVARRLSTSAVRTASGMPDGVVVIDGPLREAYGRLAATGRRVPRPW